MPRAYVGSHRPAVIKAANPNAHVGEMGSHDSNWWTTKPLAGEFDTNFRWMRNEVTVSN